MRKIIALTVLFCAFVSLPACGRSSTAKIQGNLTRAQVLEARKHFQVEVLKFDSQHEYGAEFPYSDYVRLRITNNSTVTLPYLTVLTSRFAGGRLVASSRAPSIPANNIKPGESFEYDYYPRGHMDPSLANVNSLTVEIENVIDDESMQFFRELKE